MMSKEANVRAILECNFTGFKDEIIDTAVKLICDLECEPITSPSQHWAKQAENFGEIAMNEINKARSCEDCISRKEVLEYLDKMPSELTSDGRRMVRRRTLEEYISDTLPSVTPKTDVLDKIRAEIDDARFIDKDTKICKNALASGLEVAMQIIDKYKTESEDKK